MNDDGLLNTKLLVGWGVANTRLRLYIAGFNQGTWNRNNWMMNRLITRYVFKKIKRFVHG